MSGTVVAALLIGASIYAATVCVLWKLTKPEQSAVSLRRHVISVLVASGIAFPLSVLVVALAMAVFAALCISVVLYVSLMVGIWDTEPWYAAIPLSALLTAFVVAVPTLFFQLSPRARRPSRYATRQ